jgi:hypothetical protein
VNTLHDAPQILLGKKLKIFIETLLANGIVMVNWNPVADEAKTPFHGDTELYRGLNHLIS